MQMTVFILMTCILLGGFMFPCDAMPAAARYIAEVPPATHFMRLERAVFLRGASVSQLLPHILGLPGFTAVMLAIATIRFRKKLDQSVSILPGSIVWLN